MSGSVDEFSFVGPIHRFRESRVGKCGNEEMAVTHSLIHSKCGNSSVHLEVTSREVQAKGDSERVLAV